MSQHEIQIGETDGFRYIGIKPPVSEEQAESIAGIVLPLGVGLTTRQLCVPDQGEPYTEYGYRTTDAMDSDTLAHRIAHDIAHILRNDSTEVTVGSNGVQSIGFGHELFGGRANRLG